MTIIKGVSNYSISVESTRARSSKELISAATRSWYLTTLPSMLFMWISHSIPSPRGMPVFEFLDFDDLADFYVNYNDFQTVTTLDFPEARVIAYLELKNHVSHLEYFNRAFPSLDDKNDNYFDQCLDEFDVDMLTLFSNICHSRSVQDLFKATQSFQKNTVIRWNPHVEAETELIYLGLLGINEGASKECRAVTLDLMLRAGVLGE